MVEPNCLRISTPWFAAHVIVTGLSKLDKDNITDPLRSDLARCLLSFPFVLVSTDSREEARLEQLTAGYANGDLVVGAEDIYCRSERFHPLCAYSRLRHFIFSSLVARVPNSTVPPSRAMLIHCLNQAWYVTSHSVAALSAGLCGMHPRAYEQVLRDYVQDEQGHHKFIERSLNALGCTPTQCAVTPSTVYAMQLLARVAGTNALALACFITYFEMGGLFESDPIADALRQIGSEAAARPIDAHFRINKDHQHALLPLRLVCSLQYVSGSDVLHAFQTTRAVALALQAAFQAGLQ
ncbi:iron-containing redox enzyme family protein [Burkholderia pseudomallei]|uniref:iron-containing redox enzyme family protein n=1 Tax=Burkholderia pseudomallei TaxID=28450 RepID=UPI0011C4D04D|nr:iron-containing redox enzyme family protein [Burkholderia pseudomallei]